MTLSNVSQSESEEECVSLTTEILNCDYLALNPIFCSILSSYRGCKNSLVERQKDIYLFSPKS